MVAQPATTVCLNCKQAFEIPKTGISCSALQCCLEDELWPVLQKCSELTIENSESLKSIEQLTWDGGAV